MIFPNFYSDGQWEWSGNGYYGHSRVRKELKTSLNLLWAGSNTFHTDQITIIANVTHSKINLNISEGKGILKILALCKKKTKKNPPEYLIFQTCLYFINEAKIILIS